MRKMPWRAITTLLVAWFFLVAGSCSGPSRDQPVSSASGFQIFVTADPNTVRAQPTAGAVAGEQSGCSIITAKVFRNGQLVDGASVTFTKSLGRFAVGDEEFDAVTVETVNGLATAVLCAKGQVGTSLVTATVEDASDTVIVTFF